MRRGALAALAGLALLTGCGRIIPAPAGMVQPPAGVAASTALAAGFISGPAVASLGIDAADAAAALASFRESCPRLIARDDVSGLTGRAIGSRPVPRPPNGRKGRRNASSSSISKR